MKEFNEFVTYSRDMGLDQLVEYDTNNNYVFVGRSFPGASSSDYKWQIYKHSYDTNNNLLAIRWAASSDTFNKSWDLRSTYTYSGL